MKKSVYILDSEQDNIRKPQALSDI